jgi:hypothetical protein
MLCAFFHAADATRLTQDAQYIATIAVIDFVLIGLNKRETKEQCGKCKTKEKGNRNRKRTSVPAMGFRYLCIAPI